MAEEKGEDCDCECTDDFDACYSCLITKHVTSAFLSDFHLLSISLLYIVHTL